MASDVVSCQMCDSRIAEAHFSLIDGAPYCYNCLASLYCDLLAQSKCGTDFVCIVTDRSIHARSLLYRLMIWCVALTVVVSSLVAAAVYMSLGRLDATVWNIFVAAAMTNVATLLLALPISLIARRAHCQKLPRILRFRQDQVAIVSPATSLDCDPSASSWWIGGGTRDPLHSFLPLCRTITLRLRNDEFSLPLCRHARRLVGEKLESLEIRQSNKLPVFYLIVLYLGLPGLTAIIFAIAGAFVGALAQIHLLSVAFAFIGLIDGFGIALIAHAGLGPSHWTLRRNYMVAVFFVQAFVWSRPVHMPLLGSLAVGISNGLIGLIVFAFFNARGRKSAAD